MSRRTFDVATYRDQVNTAIRLSFQRQQTGGTGECDGPAFRLGLYLPLESVLMQTDNYRGYGYLGDPDQDPTARKYH